MVAPEPLSAQETFDKISVIRGLLQSISRCMEDRMPFESYILSFLTLLRRDAVLKDFKFELPNQLRTDLRLAPLTGDLSLPLSEDKGRDFLFRGLADKLDSEAKEATQTRLTEAMISSVKVRHAAPPNRPRAPNKQVSRFSGPRLQPPFPGASQSTTRQHGPRPFRPQGGTRQKAPRFAKRSQ